MEYELISCLFIVFLIVGIHVKYKMPAAASILSMFLTCLAFALAIKHVLGK